MAAPAPAPVPAPAVTATPPDHVGDAPPDPRRWWILGVLVLSLIIVMTANISLNLAIPTLV